MSLSLAGCTQTPNGSSSSSAQQASSLVAGCNIEKTALSSILSASNYTSPTFQNETRPLILQTAATGRNDNGFKTTLYDDQTFVLVEQRRIDETADRSASVPILILKAFPKADIQKSGAQIMLSEKAVSADSLRKYLVWQDDTTVVYDLLEPLYNMRFEEYLTTVNDKEIYRSTDFSWMIAVRKAALDAMAQ